VHKHGVFVLTFSRRSIGGRFWSLFVKNTAAVEVIAGRLIMRRSSLARLGISRMSLMALNAH
jgi:hypothetical protein